MDTHGMLKEHLSTEESDEVSQLWQAHDTNNICTGNNKLEILISNWSLKF